MTSTPAANMNNCDNCYAVAAGSCAVHNGGDRPCDGAYHYYGQSPRYFPGASKGDPAVLCGICDGLLRAHRGAALSERARDGGW